MGLDIFSDGGCSVRLHLQRCLILWLCCLALPASAGFPPLPDGGIVYWSKTGSLIYYSHQGFKDPQDDLQPQAEEQLPGCQASYPELSCTIQSYNADPVQGAPYDWGGGGYQMHVRGYIRVVAIPESCAALTHEPNPITGEVGSTNEDDCSCAAGWVSSGQEPGVAPFDCKIPAQQPEECYENGQIYDAELGYCVLDCPNGQLNGVCLQDTADNAEECNSESPDYKGSIGYGSEKQNICESDTTCEGGSLGIVNGVQICVPDEYGPPTCGKDDVLVMDEFGWACSTPNDQPEETEEPEEPNTDTDGDGEPDEYRRENDPDATNKGLDKVSDSVAETNDQLGKANDQLENIGKGLSEINKSLDVGLGEVNNQLSELNDGMKSPDGGFNPDGFGGLVPTFSETASDFSQSISSIPAVSAVTGLADLPESLTCPVYTIPATPISGPIALDIHCQVFNDYRGVISALFLFFWTGTALFIFLRA